MDNSFICLDCRLYELLYLTVFIMNKYFFDVVPQWDNQISGPQPI